MDSKRKIADLKETVRVMKEDLDRADSFIERANQRIAELTRELEAVTAQNRLYREQLEAANDHFSAALAVLQHARANV
jgi:hypothetical protein